MNDHAVAEKKKRGARPDIWAVVSLVLGMLGIMTFCLIVPALLAIVSGIVSMRSSNVAVDRQPWGGIAIAGMTLGVLSLTIAALFWTRMMR